MKLTSTITTEQRIKIEEILDSRRMKRDTFEISIIEGITEQEVIRLYGEEGELYTRFCDDVKHITVIDPNTPPKGIPGVYCPLYFQDEDRVYLDYGDEERYQYEYAKWVKWFIEKILKPIGSGFEDEEEVIHDINDMGGSYRMEIIDNKISVYDVIIEFSKIDAFEED